MSNPKQLGRIGIFYIEEAICEVLFQAMEAEDDACVRAVDIDRSIGLYYERILKKLEAEGRVEQREKGGPWKLTETEYQKRR